MRVGGLQIPTGSTPGVDPPRKITINQKARREREEELEEIREEMVAKCPIKRPRLQDVEFTYGTYLKFLKLHKEGRRTSHKEEAEASKKELLTKRGRDLPRQPSTMHFRAGHNNSSTYKYHPFFSLVSTLSSPPYNT